MSASSGQRAEVVQRAAEQVLAQVEQTGPERRAAERGPDPRRVGKALDGSYEHRQLDIGLRNPDRALMHSGAIQDRLPFEQLRGAGSAVPGASFSVVGLQLEQITAERAFESAERRLDAVCRTSQRRLASPGRGRFWLTAGPALEETAKRKRAGLAGAKLPDEPPGGLLLGRVVLEHVGPAGLVCADSHTSTTTGRIIGRRPVRS